jgi:hypothetical protein
MSHPSDNRSDLVESTNYGAPHFTDGDSIDLYWPRTNTVQNSHDFLYLLLMLCLLVLICIARRAVSPVSPQPLHISIRKSERTLK